MSDNFDDVDGLNLDSLDITAPNGQVISGRNVFYAADNATSLSDYISTITDFASGSTEIGSNDSLECVEEGGGDGGFGFGLGAEFGSSPLISISGNRRFQYY